MGLVLGGWGRTFPQKICEVHLVPLWYESRGSRTRRIAAAPPVPSLRELGYFVSFPFPKKAVFPSTSPVNSLDLLRDNMITKREEGEK
jgi:hypothetical protein